MVKAGHDRKIVRTSQTRGKMHPKKVANVSNHGKVKKQKGIKYVSRLNDA